MNENRYQPVETTDLINTRKTWHPLFRQILVVSCVWNGFFTLGICLGTPTVMIPQLRREANSTVAISPEMASWISSIHGYASLPWFFIPIVSGKVGRKYPFLFVSIISLISFVVLYHSNSPIQILIAEFFQAPGFTCGLSISIFIISEYTSPKHRGLFLAIKSACMNWGIWVANALGTFFDWRTIAILGMVCSIYNILVTLFWCESPSWLASQHRYKECAKAHMWLRGDNLESAKELEELIKSCKEQRDIENKSVKLDCLTKVRRIIMEKSFYKPILVSLVVLSLYHACGKLVCTIYAIDIIKKITNKESTAYIGMLLLDGVTVAGMYIGCAFAKCLKRRTLLFTGTFGGIIFLLLLSLYLFLVKLTVISENKFISLGLLTCFFLFISVGPIILSSSIFGELLPLKYRTSGMFLTGICILFLLATMIKTGPLVFRTFGMHGAFLFYASLSLVMVLYLCKSLPETKDKTLKEIEDVFVGKQKIYEASVEARVMIDK